MCRGRCPQPCGLARGQQFSRAATPKPSGGIRSLPSLSACGLPTPVVALACIGNVDIRLFFLCKWVTLFHMAFASLHIASPERGGGPAKLVEGLTREVYFLVQPCRNRPAEFARCPRCPPGACQRRLLPLPVSVMLIFRCFLVQVGNFILYGVCKLTFVRRWRGSLVK